MSRFLRMLLLSFLIIILVRSDQECGGESACVAAAPETIEEEEDGLLDDEEEEVFVDSIVDELALKIADRIVDELEDKVISLVKSRLEEQEYQRDVERQKFERKRLEESERIKHQGCPTTLAEFVSAAVTLGGSCNRLSEWRQCQRSLDYYTELEGYIGEESCEHPDIFRHGLTTFCKEKRAILELFDIKCYHRGE